MGKNSNTEPSKKRLVFKVKKGSTIIPGLLTKSPRTSMHLQENRTPERGNVNRDLFNNFELAAETQTGSGLSPYTSPPKSFVEHSDLSMKSENRSPMNDTKRMLIYKSKYETLKTKWQHQQNQLVSDGDRGDE